MGRAPGLSRIPASKLTTGGKFNAALERSNKTAKGTTRLSWNVPLGAIMPDLHGRAERSAVAVAVNANTVGC